MLQAQIQDADILATIPEVKELINNLLILLSPKEKHIIENRYGLNDKSLATLERIGKDFGVTRERIRQIEKNALKKLTRNVVNTRLNSFNQFANGIIQKYEGVIFEDKLMSEVLTLVPDLKTVNVFALRLSIELDANLERMSNTINYRPFYKLKTIERNEIIHVCNAVATHLAPATDVQTIDVIVEALEKALAKKYSKQFVMSCLELDRRIKLVKRGVGLARWRHINPRTLRDKIMYILRETQKPLHYIEIANKIAEAHFDAKLTNIQAVHNELIRDDSFVLIGRGIYALREWGYQDGTVSEVIADILKEKGPLDREQIITEVLKRRHVKRITIILNLKNKPIFDRVGRNTYALKA